MTNQPDSEDFKRFLEQFMANREGLDPEQLADLAGLARDPEQLAELIKQLQAAIAQVPGAANQGVNWKLAGDQAKEAARKSARAITEAERSEVANAARIGALWLDQATTLGDTNQEPKLIGRELWIDEAIPLFQALASPIADRMSEALSRNLVENAPDELSGILGSATGLIRSAGGAMFAMQLGQALGRLSTEVLTAGDIGIPLFQEARAAVIAQNLTEALTDLDVETEQARIYLLVREAAHARLFRHAKWLREAIVSQISAYATGLEIDNSRLEELAGEMTTSDLDALRNALESGAFIAEPNEDQRRNLENIEHLLALVEGWVQVVTADACRLLPQSAALGEYVRRRRATGGPAEKTFGQLIGLELRPRRLREASELWRKVTEAAGIERRDAIWDHPDLLPTPADIDAADAYAARVAGSTGDEDDLDRELRDLLGE